ncbi:MAG: hypothetical protein ACPLVD_02575 [Dictyoglomus turgidum]|uniref:hypothetical protein n=1 Tax=Dictyoglomus turgidum TaxID=513050 RepID=UPI003C716F41
MKRLIFTTIFIFVFSVTSAQTLSFNGNMNINSYYAYFSGDSSLNYLSSEIQEGIYFYQNSQFSIDYLTKNLSLNFSYQSQPKERVDLFLRSENFYMNFSNELYQNFSPLTLYNKILNGIYSSYERKKLNMALIFAKIEGRKKMTKFNGNETQGPYFIGDFFLIPYKERAYLNGNLLKRDEDYIIDYTYGVIYFNFVVSFQDEVILEYEISGNTEIYNVAGLGIGYSPFKLSYISLQSTSTNTQRSFIEGSFKIKRDENNFLEIRRSYALLENNYSGYADYLKLSFKGKIINSNLEIINSTENYPYIPEILGNFNLTPGLRNLTLNLNLTPLSIINYYFSYNLSGDNIKWLHNLSMNSTSLKLSLSYREENNKNTQVLNFTYIPINLYGMIQKINTGSSTINTCTLSLLPKINNFNPSFYFSQKEQLIGSSYIKEQEIGGSISLIGKIFDFSIGGNYKVKGNLDPQAPIPISQNFITNGETYIFELNYTPLQDSINLYINNTYISNNGTFTYYLPDGTYKTYTVNYYTYNNTIFIFFIDEEGENPPPAGLNITINYQTILPQRTFSQSTFLKMRVKYFNLNPLLTLQRNNDNNFVYHNISLSTYGMPIQNLWISLTGNKDIERPRGNLSLNANYYLKSSSLNFNFYYNETENMETMSSKTNLNLSFNPYDFIIYLEYYQNYYYQNFYKNLSLSFELKRSFSFGDFKIKITKNKREASYSLAPYKKNLQNLSFSKKFNEYTTELSFSHEYYSDKAERYIIGLFLTPTKTLPNSSAFIKYILNKKETNLHIFQIGGNISINF